MTAMKERQSLDKSAATIADLTTGARRHSDLSHQAEVMRHALRSFAEQVREDCVSATGKHMRELADELRAEAVETIRELRTAESARVVHIAVDPGFDGVPSALFALTADGTIWQRMIHLTPSAWERVAPPPGTEAQREVWVRHLDAFRAQVERHLDPKLVQDLYDAAEEAATTTMTTTQEQPA